MKVVRTFIRDGKKYYTMEFEPHELSGIVSITEVDTGDLLYVDPEVEKRATKQSQQLITKIKEGSE